MGWVAPSSCWAGEDADVEEGTCLLVALLGAMSSGLTAYGISPFASALYGALGNGLGIALFILSGAPVTGALSRFPSGWTGGYY